MLLPKQHKSQPVSPEEKNSRGSQKQGSSSITIPSFYTRAADSACTTSSINRIYFLAEMVESNYDSAMSNPDQIFHDLNDPVEYVDEYRPGGYHPIRLGEVLRDGRYLVMRKLGYGSYSTVWLARDRVLQEFVAVKILKARCSGQHEIKIYNLLANDTKYHPGRSNVMSLKDHFSIKGPNGTHSCLVYEAMGPSVSHMTWDRVSGEVLKAGQSKRFVLAAARTMLYHLLLGLNFIHSKGLAHGDFHSGNLLFSLRNMSDVSAEDLGQSRDMVSAPVRRLDGNNDPSAPDFLTLDQPLREYVATGNDLQIKISDLGSAFSIDSPPADPKTPVDVRSPELLLHKHISTTQDIWAFGCLLYTLLTNRPLFELWDLGNRDYLDDDHIIQMVALLGPLPEDLKSVWPRYRNYFDENDIQTVFVVDWAPSIGSLDDNVSDSHHPEEIEMRFSESNTDEDNSKRERGLHFVKKESTQQLYPSLVEVYDNQTPDVSESGLIEDPDVNTGPIQLPLRDRWLQEKHPGITPEEAEAVASLLQQIFRYDPTERPTTADLLRHPWVEDFCKHRGGEA